MSKSTKMSDYTKSFYEFSQSVARVFATGICEDLVAYEVRLSIPNIDGLGNLGYFVRLEWSGNIHLRFMYTYASWGNIQFKDDIVGMLLKRAQDQYTEYMDAIDSGKLEDQDGKPIVLPLDERWGGKGKARGMQTPGRRNDSGKPHNFAPGDYGKAEDGEWYAVPPRHVQLLAALRHHTVVEHEDGTITVTPSIEVSNSFDRWYGFLDHGVWSEC